jgi:hypothetical protein
MDILKEIDSYIEKFEELSKRFLSGNMLGSFLSTEDAATFKQYLFEVIALINGQLGAHNMYTVNIITTVNNGSTSFPGGPTLSVDLEVIAILRATRKQVERNLTAPKPQSTSKAVEDYIATARINELGAIRSQSFDLSRLIQLCNELNLAHAGKAYMSIAMLTRAIIDHVPPIFGKKTFAEVANNHSGGKSFGDAMRHLDISLRNVADNHLHVQIRSKESLPAFTQVDFRSDFDLLIGEIVRLLK